MHISDYMRPELVCFLSTTTRNETLQALVHHVAHSGGMKDKHAFYQAIIDREEVVSTGIGMGVAIPHAKLPTYNNFFIAIAILKKPIDWHSLDGAPVQIVFMIGGPDDKQTEYLQILSCLTKGIKDEEIRKKIVTLHEPIAIVELFQRI